MNANTPQPRTLEVSLVWARESMAMTTYTNVVLYAQSLWFIKLGSGSHAFLVPNIKIHILKTRNPSCGSLPSSFRWHDFSEAPSAAGTERNELSPVAAGGEAIGRRTPVVVINNTMSNGHVLTCEAYGALSKRRQDYVRFALFRISSTLSDQVGAEPTETGKMFPLAPSGFEALSSAASQF